MTTLSINASGELCLTLRGEAENLILETLRRWPHWQRVALEHDPDNAQRYLAVTLIADASRESTVRDILKRSFNLIFPDDGGSCTFIPQNAPSGRKTRGHR